MFAAINLPRSPLLARRLNACQRVPWNCRPLVCVTAMLGLSATIGAAVATENPKWLTVDRIFHAQEFKSEDWKHAQWLKDGTGYTRLEDSPDIKDAEEIVRYEPATGAREVLVAAARLIPPEATQPLKLDGYAWSDDGRRLLLFTNAKRVWRQNTRGDYWILDLGGGPLRQLGGPAEPSRMMFATFSPDGRQVAYVYRNNLFVQNLTDLAITQLTHDGSDTVINGTADWVNEEEFHLRHGFRWSPDNQRIAYWQFDTSYVPQYHLLNTTDALYPEITSFSYPKVGQTNSICRVGAVEASGGKTRWFDPGVDPRNHYIPEMEWEPGSKAVVLQLLNRLQNTNRVLRGRVPSGRIEEVFQDRDEAWLDVSEEWHWLKRGKRFLWLSEGDGWRHLYAVAPGNAKPRLLTPGEYDVISVAGVDEPRGGVYFIGSPDNATQRYLFRAALNGRGKPQRITPADQPGTHAYTVSPDGSWAFHTWSRFGQPPVTDLVRLPEHARVRVLADNSELRAKLAQLEACPAEFFRVPIGGGVELDAWCLKPPNFDPVRRYPLMFHVYGEPAGQTVLDRWGGDNYLWHCLLAQRGYVVMSVDNRGTDAPRGRPWRKCIYRQVGILASADQAAAARQILETRPYLDPDRVGIWGWSGGGSMTLNAIFRYPDLYLTAMAIAFVSDERFYDTIYQERYMGLPDDNAEGYKNGSPITHAHQLAGNLLLVYGTGDDNCHYQNCEVLVSELVRHNKPFALMTYPNRTHGIKEGENTKRHLYETLTRYLETHLPTGREL